MRTQRPERGFRTAGYAGLALVVGVLTVVVPPLLTPGADPGPAPAVSRSTPAAPTATPVVPRDRRCSSSAGGSAPACTIWADALGTGWAARGTDIALRLGERVPGGEQPAIRIDKRGDDASVTFTARRPVAVAGKARLRLRVFGGREYGTVLLVSASAAAGRRGTEAVVLRVPAERWRSFTVDVGELLPGTLRRIDLVVAADQLPQSFHFFVDDLVLAG